MASGLKKVWDWIRRYQQYLGLPLVLLLAVIFSPVRHGAIIFLDPGNLTDILRQVSEKGILAAGMALVVISGGIDLSVGSLLALGATASAVLIMDFSMPTTAVLFVVLIMGAFLGAANGVIIVRGRMQPFVATLAMMIAARGFARLVSGGAGVPLGFGEGAGDASFQLLGEKLFDLVPVPALIFLATIAVVSVLLNRTVFGRYIYAIGGNEKAARLSGIRVGRTKVAVYLIAGLLSALAGVIHCAQLQQGNPNDGVAYELDAIAAVVIGGVSLSGGRGTAMGALVGILIIGVINNILGLRNVDANLQLILKGLIIVVAVWLQRRNS